MSRPPRARLAVLDAAERLLLRHGADGFTLDAVAAEAGVSKGGLIYHFASKDALLTGIVERAVDAVDRVLARAAEATEPGAFARAYLDVTMPAPDVDRVSARRADEQADEKPDEKVVEEAGGSPTAALVAAVAHDPRQLDPLRRAYVRWQARLEQDGLDVGAATAVRLAADGWWLAMLLDLPPVTPEVHARTRALLESLCRPRR